MPAKRKSAMGAAASTPKATTRSAQGPRTKKATAADIQRDFKGEKPLLNVPPCYYCDKHKLSCYRHPSGDLRKPCYECSRNKVHGTAHCNHDGRIPDYSDRHKQVWFVGRSRDAYNHTTEYEPFNPDPRQDSYSDDKGRKGWEGRLAYFREVALVGPKDETAEEALKWPSWQPMVVNSGLVHRMYIAAPRESGHGKRKAAGGGQSSDNQIRDTDYSEDESEDELLEDDDEQEPEAEASTSAARKRPRRGAAQGAEPSSSSAGAATGQASSSDQADEAQAALELQQAFEDTGVSFDVEPTREPPQEEMDEDVPEDEEDVTTAPQQQSDSSTAAPPRRPSARAAAPTAAPADTGSSASPSSRPVASPPTDPNTTGGRSSAQSRGGRPATTPSNQSSTTPSNPQNQSSSAQANQQHQSDAQGNQGQDRRGGAPSGNKPDHISCNPHGRPPFGGKLSAELIKKLAGSARGAVTDFTNRRGGPPAGDPSGAASATSGRDKLKTYAYAAQPPRGEYRRRAGSEPPPSTGSPSDDANARPAAEEHPITMDRMTAMEALEYIIHVVYEGPDAVYSAEAAAHLLKAIVVLEQLLPVVGARGMGAEQYLYSMSFTGVTYFNFGKRNHGWPWRIWAQDYLEHIVRALPKPSSSQPQQASTSDEASRALLAQLG